MHDLIVVDYINIEVRDLIFYNFRIEVRDLIFYNFPIEVRDLVFYNCRIETREFNLRKFKTRVGSADRDYEDLFCVKLGWVMQ